MITSPLVRNRFDDHIATWPGDKLAKVCFSYEDLEERVVVTDVTRNNLPKGSAGLMVARAIITHGIMPQPRYLRAMNVLDKDAQFGRSSILLLTDVLARAAKALGGTVTGSEQGMWRGKTWVEVAIAYA